METLSLEEIKEVELGILRELDRVCKREGLAYFLAYGTLIGALRHQGYIPWDDDVDVLLTRADYERFLAEAPALLQPQFDLHNTRTVPDFPFMFTKMVLKDTLLIPEFAKDSTYRMPMFLDILPVDNIPEDPKAFRAMSRRSWWWGRLLFVRGTPRPYLIGITGIKRALIYSATTTAHWGMRALRMSPRFLQGRWERAVRRYENVETERMADFTMRDPETWALSRAELFPTRDMPFEDITVMLPHEYDTLLRRGYGEYMELPPVEKRRNHIPHTVDFGPYTEELEGKKD